METCRICLDTTSPMLSPCKCTGTSKFVHGACLEHWIHVSKRTSCEICKTLFPLHLEPEERDCTSPWVYAFLVNPVFHILVQYFALVAMRPIHTYSEFIHLFFIQQIGTLSLYAFYVGSHVRHFERYIHQCYTPFFLLHMAFLFTLILTLPHLHLFPLLTIMGLCHMLVSFYPRHHTKLMETLNQNRRIVIDEL